MPILPPLRSPRRRGRRPPRRCEEEGRRAIPLLPKYPRPSLTKPLDLGVESLSPHPQWECHKHNQRSSVRQLRDTMDTNRDTMDTTAAIVMRQSTVFGIFVPYHMTHTRQRKRPNILDSHPASASYSALTTSCRNTKPQSEASAGDSSFRPSRWIRTLSSSMGN